jgi:hypothetical protein
MKRIFKIVSIKIYVACKKNQKWSFQFIDLTFLTQLKYKQTKQLNQQKRRDVAMFQLQQVHKLQTKMKNEKKKQLHIFYFFSRVCAKQ